MSLSDENQKTSGKDDLVKKFGGKPYRRYRSNAKEFLSCARRYTKKGRPFMIRAVWSDNDIELVIWDKDNKVTEARYIKSSNVTEVVKLIGASEEIGYSNFTTEALKVLAEATKT